MYDKKDCCIIASTGFGKSLIYQYPAVYLKKLVVVISPLIALMQDQVFSLQKKGIKACFFGSQQMDKTLRMIDHDIVYITPEFYTLGSGKSALFAVKDKIALFAIDEAHVLDQWGNDFRPSYKKLFELRQNYPSVPIIALTATAPKYVETMIISSLRLRPNYHFVKTALDRPNLEFIIQRKRFNYAVQILPYLKQVTEGSAIVYCLTRNLTVEIAKHFTSQGIPCKPYHAGLPALERKELVNDFRNNKVKFVICTIAFGMGIDKSDVRLVLHYGLPKSLEAYYQEAGRAGRDGKPSKCVLLHNNDDQLTILSLLNDPKKEIAEEHRKQQRELLQRVVAFAESKQCRRLEVLNYLGTTDEELEKITIRDNCCDNCRHDLIYKVPTHLRYQDISEDGYYDFTNDSRLFLNVVSGKTSGREVVENLIGELPTQQTYNRCNLEFLNIGKHKSREWWMNLLSLLITYRYIDYADNSNVLRLNYKSKKLLRYMTKSLRMIPSSAMLTYLVKKEDVEFFWEKNTKVISHRPKARQTTISQDLNRTALDDNEDLDDILNVCDQIESDSMLIEETDAQVDEIIDISDDENFFNEDTLKAIENAEQNEKMKTKKITKSQLSRDKKEVEDILKNIEEDSDDDEDFLDRKRRKL